MKQIGESSGKPYGVVRLKIVGPRRQRALGIDNFTGGLFPDTELPWSDPRPLLPPRAPLLPLTVDGKPIRD